MSNNLNKNTIFNVPEPQGAEFETTAAEAQAHAPTARIAHQVESNADRAKGAAEQAASFAKTKGSSLTGEKTTAVDQFRQEASQTTNSAVSEGKHDVEAAKATGAGYVEQAKSMASTAISTAQQYLPTSVGGTADNAGGGIVSSVQTTATSALETASEYLTAAKESAQPHIEKAKGVAQGYLGTAGTQGAQMTKESPSSSTGVPATSAPLESGPHTVNTPYPSTATTTGTNIGQNAGGQSLN